MIDSSPTLDRFDPSLGYIEGNVWVICWQCNRRKQDMAPERLIAFGFELIEAFKQVTHCLRECRGGG